MRQEPAIPDTITIGGDLTVRRLGFGAMRITGRGIWGEPPEREGALALLRRVVARGVKFIDTADSYGPEISETLIAEALHPYPPGLVIATKGGLIRPGPNRWERNGRPDHLKRACTGSLRRLRLERIDLYQLHAVDPQVPLAESIGALLELRQEGKIRHVGLSNINTQQLAEARRLGPIVSVQNRYNLEDRMADDVLDACTRERLAFLPWAPLAAGALAQPGRALDRIARRHHASPPQIALAWLLARSPVMLPIPGTASISHFEDNLAAAEIELAPEEVDALSRAAAGAG